MKVALAQLNSTVGDVAGNTARAVQAVQRAAALGADLAILPELFLSGYPPLDLLERPAFVEANERAVQQVADAAQGVHAVVGHVAAAESPTGKLVANAASLVRDGRIVARRDKTLLPTYDVFDELRYFQPASANSPVQVGGTPVGITVCEDAWNDRTFWKRRLYGADPVEDLAAQGARLLLNVAASPYSVGRQQVRRAMLSATARRHGLPIAYVNLVGGNDQLIFDGRSFALDAQGRLIAEAAAFREDLLIVDMDREGSEAPATDLQEPEEVLTALKLGLCDYARKCGFSSAVLALSGGIDSALVAAVAASAFGPENVTALFMPTTYSSDRSRQDAEEVARRLGVRWHVVPIEELRVSSLRALDELFAGTEPGVAEENIQARIRGNLVMAYANKFGALPLATGNKSELAVGYCTLYGDMVGGLAVIGDVPKTMVYRLVEWINREEEAVPRSIIERPPTAELKPDQTDQDVLPPYDVLDGVLDLYVEQGRELEDIVAEGYEPETVRRVLTMVDRAEFKRRQAPITLRVTSKAFGPGRRLPVAEGWTGAQGAP